jgi:membrane peptidoglycan carboxypeptidase
MQKNTKILLGASLASLLLLGALVALGLESLTSLPDFNQLKASVEYPIKLADGTKSKRLVGPRAPGWVPVSDISDHLLMAVIASEDTSFFTHKGVDFFELKEAVKKDWKEKRWARGASTLTQQVIKNIYLDPEKTMSRKIKEILWARELEKVLHKSQILCLYVNMAEWGPGIYGIQNAASHYFGIAPSELTAKQSAFLAMLLPSPIKYHSYFVRKELSSWASSRVERILNVMNSMGFIDDPTYQEALNETLWESANSSPDTNDIEMPEESSDTNAPTNDTPESAPNTPQTNSD